MALNQKTRSEIDNNYKWDLSTIYKSNAEFTKEYEVVKNMLPEIKVYEKTLMDSASNLYNFCLLDTKISDLIDKLFTYAHLKSDEDLTNVTNQELVGKITNLYHEYYKMTTFFKPTLMKYSYNKIKKFCKDEPRLKEYEFIFIQLFRYKNHTLSELEEKIVSELSKSLDAASENYEKLTDADMKFGSIINEQGEEVELTESNYRKFIESSDRRVREDAFKQLFKVYSSFKNTLASTYANEVEKEVALAKIYKYNGSLEASLYEDNIDPLVYDNLIKTVNSNLPILHNYYVLRKEVLNLSDQHLYDTYVSLIKETNSEYPFEMGEQLVKDALKVLGDDYLEILNKAFSEKWIDVYNNVGKRGGAYSGGSYETNPYILLNYENTLNDVSTLAHELGHSIHSYYSRENNPYHYASYSIFVAEVASTVNELILSRYLLDNSKDDNQKLVILNRLLELFKGTIFRQTMFAEFEKEMHNGVLNGEVLTNEYICSKYYDLVKKYFGDSVVIDEEIAFEWSRIPHFYTSFYVYKYATGLSAAAYIVNGILSNKKNALENYKKFLSTGASMYPLDELKVAGVDMTDSKVVESAIMMFNDTLNEFKKILERKK